MQSVYIDYLLRATISAVVLLATMLLGMGERTATLTLVSLGMVVVSAYVSDFKRLFHLSQRMADWTALGVVAVTAANAFHEDRPGQLFAVAHLQSYLQYVLLFQPKTTRIYWQLAVLSLGQVAIASTLVPGIAFGFLLLAYLFAGVVTFVLLLLRAQSQRYGSADGTAPASALPRAAVGAQRSPQAPMLMGNSARVEPRAIVVGVVAQSAFLCAFAVAVAAVLFFALPRWDIPNREVATTEPLHSVGFSKKVTLGELGEVVNNPDLVMRIEFFRGLETRAFKPAGEPLFRGTVVTRYERGEWTQADRKSVAALQVEFKSPFVRQRVTAEPSDVAELSCVFPVFAVRPDFRLRLDTAGDQLIRQEDYRVKPIEFEIGTNGMIDDRQRTILPCDQRLRDREVRELLQIPQAAAGQNDALAGLRATAALALEGSGIDPSQRVAATRAINEYLSSSGRYLYSIERQPRDRAIDPLEDFVTRHPVGHCEYFAGALVMMLRSQGIPARMAIGFKGGEWNPLGMYYQVQQLHAHAWVEVYLGKEDIPPGEFSDDETPAAAWLVLDPTAGAQESDSAAQGESLLARFRHYLDYTQVLWINYVAGLNSKRQRQGIYDPLAQGAEAAVENVISPEVWQERVRIVNNSHLGTFWQWYRRHWFSWRGGLVAAGFSLVVILLYVSARTLIRALRRLGLAGAARFGNEPPVLEMYRRLEAALARHGLTRHPAQTAYEFALAAGGELAEHIEHRRVAHLPRRIVDVFYRVRFGGRTLDNLEADAVEHALAELERTLAEPR